MKKVNEVKENLGIKENIFGETFFIDLMMLIPLIDIMALIHWKVKNKTRYFQIGLAAFCIKIIFILALIMALSTVLKVSPTKLFTTNINEAISTTLKKAEIGHLNIGNTLLQITSDDGLLMLTDKEKVVLYTEDQETKVVLYEDSGIEVGSLSAEDMSKEMEIEDPAKMFDSYEVKQHNVAEKLGINKKDCYVSYTYGNYKIDKTEEYEGESGQYTELYVLQDIGAERYLRIRIAAFTGEEPIDLVTKYVLTLVDPLF